MQETTSETKRLRRNASATAAELREFLASMHGKSPREMLGSVATSKLGKATIQASVGVAAAIAVLTIIPYLWGVVFDKKVEEPSAPPVAEVPQNTPSPNPEQGTTTDPLETMGINESR